MQVFPLEALKYAARDLGDGGVADSDIAVAIMDSLKSGFVGYLGEKGYSEKLISSVNELESEDVLGLLEDNYYYAWNKAKELGLLNES